VYTIACLPGVAALQGRLGLSAKQSSTMEFVLAHGMAIDCVGVTAAVRESGVSPLNTGDSTDADV